MNQVHQEQLKVSNNCHKYYFLDRISEHTFLIEREYFPSNRNLQTNLSRNSNNNSPTSTTKIIVALGFITALLCFAGMQLHRAVNIESVQHEKQTEKAAAINRIEKPRKITTKQFAWRIY